MNSLERIFECLFQYFATLFLTNPLLKIHLQSEFYECRCIPTILSMAITHSKEVESRQILHVWSQNKTILIYFIRIIRLEPNSSSESELLHYIFRFNYFSFDLLFADDKLWKGLCVILKIWNVFRSSFWVRSGMNLCFALFSMLISFNLRILNYIADVSVTWWVFHCVCCSFALLLLSCVFTCFDSVVDSLERGFLCFTCIDVHNLICRDDSLSSPDWI